MKKENIFKQKLYHHTTPVRDGLWDAIEAQLPPQKDQRIFPLFWLVLFGATLMSGLLMIGIVSQRQSLRPDPKPSQVAISSHGSSSNSLSSSDNFSASNESSSASSDVKGFSERTKTSESAATNQKTTATNILKPSLNNSSSSKSTHLTRSTPDKKTAQEENASSTAQLFEKTIKNESPNAVDVIRSTSYENLTPPVGLTQTSAQNNNHLAIIPFLPQQEVTLHYEANMVSEMSAVKPDPNCYKFSGTGSKLVFSIDVFTGPGFSPKSFEQLDSESSYADARVATENHQYGWSTGARLNLQHRSGFTGRIGLTYTQAGDIFDYTDSLATQSTTRIDSFFAADGTFLYTETSQVLILGTLIKKIHNTYRYLDVPLIIGYEMPLGRSTFLVNAGPVFNLSSSHEGQILDPNLHPRSIKEGDPGAISVYKSNIGLSLYLGAGYLFPISNHFSGLIEPTYIYRLSPVTLASYPLKEQRHYVGLNLGIRYHIQ